MNSRQYVQLAQSLPPRLLRFFARYPPQAIASSPANPPGSANTVPNPSSSDPATPAINEGQASTNALEIPSPFRSQKHPVTGKWHDPAFSLRRQAELVKLARQYGVEDLLPYTVKGTAERLRQRAENGLRVKGTGVGQRVKGKESERTMKARYVAILGSVLLALRIPHIVSL